MAGRHNSKQNQRSSKAKARRRRAAIGLGGGAGAFLALGLGPLANAPAAQADGLDAIFDPIVNAVTGSLTSAVDPLAGLGSLAGADPFSSLDLSGLSSP